MQAEPNLRAQVQNSTGTVCCCGGGLCWKPAGSNVLSYCRGEHLPKAAAILELISEQLQYCCNESEVLEVNARNRCGITG